MLSINIVTCNYDKLRIREICYDKVDTYNIYVALKYFKHRNNCKQNKS